MLCLTHLFRKPASLLLGVVSLGISSLSMAQDFTENCVNINSQQQLIEQYIEQAPYRQALPSKTATFSYSQDQSYQAYLDYAQNLIAQRNPRAMMSCPLSSQSYQLLAKQQQWLGMPKVVQLIAPFELSHTDNNKAVLLIHGLTDSPYHFHDLAWHFYQQGYDVRTLLLPGHGTAPSDLVNVTYKQWQQAADYAIERTAKDYQQVYLGGFSTGGALILNHLLEQPDNKPAIKGVMLWSPASQASSGVAWMAKYVSWLSTWLDKEGDIDFAKYESFPYNAGAQVHGLMKRMNKRLAKADTLPDIPLLVVASEHDQTISTAATLELLSQWQSKQTGAAKSANHLVYYGEQSSIPEALNSQVMIEFPSCTTASCSAVKDVAHTATINAPSNPHYGENGHYRNCSHYLADLPSYQQCKQSKSVVKGEKTEQNLAQTPHLQRLSYNPYYQQMLRSIEQFMQ
ncbi:alpha/beta fold hydrolase [Agarivorans sp. B2Z047]|uniref:alpha/beta hydrolase n=1 Tax=Agarivorans sp. B2Z047 TaxID=2652721 RepID=UPI00128E5C5D|nr:alpha/beta hydrolase [Agarivorans sp. B2Z047]MPW29897.1 alpha/beta fold hydrolase [Agarivorans sp. B2Z047]UQN43465.1 alpha/beta hydrolase [Agarivorans sp. B2Z047]